VTLMVVIATLVIVIVLGMLGVLVVAFVVVIATLVIVIILGMLRVLVVAFVVAIATLVIVIIPLRLLIVAAVVGWLAVLAWNTDSRNTCRLENARDAAQNRHGFAPRFGFATVAGTCLLRITTPSPLLSPMHADGCSGEK
jgi:hypothetical protein